MAYMIAGYSSTRWLHSLQLLLLSVQLLPCGIIFRIGVLLEFIGVYCSSGEVGEFWGDGESTVYPYMYHQQISPGIIL